MLVAFLSDLWPYIAAAGAAIALWLGNNVRQRAKGRKGAETKAEEADHENAANIRNRVDRNLDDRVRKHDGAGWRDE